MLSVKKYFDCVFCVMGMHMWWCSGVYACVRVCV